MRASYCRLPFFLVSSIHCNLRNIVVCSISIPFEVLIFKNETISRVRLIVRRGSVSFVRLGAVLMHFI